MAEADGRIVIDTEVDTSGVRDGVSEINRSFDGVEKGIRKADSALTGLGGTVRKIEKMFAAAFAVKKLVQFGNECIELGSDLAEVKNVVDVTFTTMSDKVNEFAKSAMTTAGMSETMAKRYIGTFGAMAKSFGYSEKEAYDMSTALTQLTGDVASFRNLSQDEAYTKMKSVFTGETESLKELGVVMTQSALDQYALANGYGKTTAAMTEQEKVGLRMAFVQQQLTAASGDFIRTSDSWANQTRVMQLQIESLKATIGQGLINIFTPVLQVINILLGKLATLANAFKAFTELITGRSSSGSTDASGAGLVGDTAADMESGYNEAADGAENLADATKDTAAATKEAAKAAKAYLSPLDEISKISSDSDAGGTQGGVTTPGSGGGGNDIGGSGAVQNVDYGKLAEGETELERMNPVLDLIIKKLKQLGKLLKKGFWDGLGGYKPILAGLQDDILSVGKSLKQIFTSREVLQAANTFAESCAYNLGRVAGSVASIGLTIGTNLVGGIESYLSRNSERIKSYISNMLKIDADIADIIGDWTQAFADVFSTVFGSQAAQEITGSIIGIFSTGFGTATQLAASFVRDVGTYLTAPFVNNKETIKEALLGTIEPLQTIASSVETVIQAIADMVLGVYNEHVKQLFGSVTQGINDILGILLEGYNTYIVPVLSGVSEQIAAFMAGPFAELIGSVENFLISAINLLKTLWENVLVPLLKWISSKIMPVVAPILKAVGTQAIAVFATISKVASGILDALGGVLTFLDGVFSGDWKKIFSGLAEVLQGFQKSANAIFEFIRENVFAPLDAYLSDIFEADWTEVFGAVGNVANAFFEKVSELWEALKDTFDGIITFINGVFSGNWSEAWKGLVSIFASIWEGILAIAKAPVNGIIGLFNGLVKGVNDILAGIESVLKFDFTIPNPFGGTIMDYHWQATLPRLSGSIPYLASGAVIPPRSEFLAVLGDQKRGNNIETPEALLRKIVREESGNNDGNGGECRLVIQLNRRTIYEQVIEEARIRQRNTGRNPFELA